VFFLFTEAVIHIMIEKFSQALMYLDKGKVPPFWELLPSNYEPNGTEFGHLQTIDSNVEVPSWVNFEGDISYKTNVEQNWDSRDAFLCLTNSNHRVEAEITPSNPTAGCRFHILNARNYREISVKATGYTGNNEKFIEKTKFVSGKQMLVNVHPVVITFDRPVDEITLEIIGDKKNGSVLESLSAIINNTNSSNLSISSPTLISPKESGTPIFLVSIDSFRHDYLDIFDSVKSKLGSDVVIPSEPRTQGRYTRPSHASLLTGVHPGTHKYCTGFGRQLDKGIPLTSISPDLETLPEVLTEQGYCCGASTSWGSVSPEFGFGRGFQKFNVETRDWKKYNRDGTSIINQALDWTEQMVSSNQTNFFHFMHIFDAHLPYLSFRTLTSDNEIDVSSTDKFKDDYINKQPLNYHDLIEYSKNVEEPNYINDIKEYYRRSLNSVSDKLLRFFTMLECYNILDDSLIIIVGDHGEEFLERGIAGHATLNDANIRPGMMVKPPKNKEFPVPDKADFIDIYPTISDYLTGKVPDQCVGRSWLRMDANESSQRTRVTEAFTGDSTYAVSIEQDVHKGIFAFDADIPARPTDTQIQAGPKYIEFCNVKEMREDVDNTDTQLTKNEKKQFERLAVDFITNKKNNYGKGEEVTISSDVEMRLEELGYK